MAQARGQQGTDPGYVLKVEMTVSTDRLDVGSSFLEAKVFWLEHLEGESCHQLGRDSYRTSSFGEDQELDVGCVNRQLDIRV